MENHHHYTVGKNIVVNAREIQKIISKIFLSFYNILKYCLDHLFEQKVHYDKKIIRRNAHLPNDQKELEGKLWDEVSKDFSEDPELLTYKSNVIT